jgi:hypothetical protein
MRVCHAFSGEAKDWHFCIGLGEIMADPNVQLIIHFWKSFDLVQLQVRLTFKCIYFLFKLFRTHSL